MATVFVYGTLMFPEVLKALIGRVPRLQRATIKGYQRYAIKGQVFPGTIPGAADSQVRGLVLFELDEAEMRVFNEFEGEEYYRARVRPELADGSSVEAEVYVWQDALRPLLQGDWDEEGFRATHLPRYTLMCADFAASLK